MQSSIRCILFATTLLAATSTAHIYSTFSDANCTTQLTSGQVTAGACTAVSTGSYYKLSDVSSGQCVTSCSTGKKSPCGACRVLGVATKLVCNATTGLATTYSCTDTACANCVASSSATNISSATCPSSSSSYGILGTCDWTVSSVSSTSTCTAASIQLPLVCSQCNSDAGNSFITCGVSVPSALLAAALMLVSVALAVM